MIFLNIFWQSVHKVPIIRKPCPALHTTIALQSTHVKGYGDSERGSWGCLCLCGYSFTQFRSFHIPENRHKMHADLQNDLRVYFALEVPVAQHENHPLNTEVLRNLRLIRPPSSSPSLCFLCGFRFTSLGLFVVVWYYLINYCGSCSCQKAGLMPCFINIYGHVTIFHLWGSKCICDYFFQINQRHINVIRKINGISPWTVCTSHCVKCIPIFAASILHQKLKMNSWGNVCKSGLSVAFNLYFVRLKFIRKSTPNISRCLRGQPNLGVRDIQVCCPQGHFALQNIFLSLWSVYAYFVLNFTTYLYDRKVVWHYFHGRPKRK